MLEHEAELEWAETVLSKSRTKKVESFDIFGTYSIGTNLTLKKGLVPMETTQFSTQEHSNLAIFLHFIELLHAGIIIVTTSHNAFEAILLLNSSICQKNAQTFLSVKRYWQKIHINIQYLFTVCSCNQRVCIEKLWPTNSSIKEWFVSKMLKITSDWPIWYSKGLIFHKSALQKLVYLFGVHILWPFLLDRPRSGMRQKIQI